MKIGFVGCGNMATAIIKGIIKKQIIEEENIMASAKTKTTLERVQRELGIKVSMDNSEVVKNSDIVVLAVKPQYYQEVIELSVSHPARLLHGYRIVLVRM